MTAIGCQAMSGALARMPVRRPGKYACRPDGQLRRLADGKIIIVTTGRISVLGPMIRRPG